MGTRSRFYSGFLMIAIICSSTCFARSYTSLSKQEKTIVDVGKVPAFEAVSILNVYELNAGISFEAILPFTRYVYRTGNGPDVMPAIDDYGRFRWIKYSFTYNLYQSKLKNYYLGHMSDKPISKQAALYSNESKDKSFIFDQRYIS